MPKVHINTGQGKLELIDRALKLIEVSNMHSSSDEMMSRTFKQAFEAVTEAYSQLE